MRGLFGGVVSGGVVSVLTLSVASVVSEQPAGIAPPQVPLIDAPAVENTPDPVQAPLEQAQSTPVGSLSIEEPQAPALPDAEAALEEPESPIAVATEQSAPNADTAPLDEPNVVVIEGTLAAPEASQGANPQGEVIDPVLPNPLSLAPQTPVSETNVIVSTAPAAPVEAPVSTLVPTDETDDVPVIVIDDIEEPTASPDDTAVEDAALDDLEFTDLAQERSSSVVIEGTEAGETFVVDLGVEGPTRLDAATPEIDVEPETQALVDATEPTGAEVEGIATELSPVADNETEIVELDILSQADDTRPAGPRISLQGAENTLLSDRGTGVTVRRFGVDADEAETSEEEVAAQQQAGPVNALIDYAATSDETDGRPLMSIVLIDDGSMSAASAALAGLPFDVTIALDPAMDGVNEILNNYRADGFEAAALAKVPEGAQPSDVEITFESVFRSLPETVAVLDIGEGGLQADRAVTEQAMEILAAQGRGFVSVSQGLNTATRAADQAGVPAGLVFRDLDSDGQDARVVRRFVDQAAFQARRESGVILVGRVRPDTISALILWGTANQNDQVAIVPLSAVLKAQ